MGTGTWGRGRVMKNKKPECAELTMIPTEETFYLRSYFRTLVSKVLFLWLWGEGGGLAAKNGSMQFMGWPHRPE